MLSSWSDIGNICGFAIILVEHFVMAAANGDGGVFFLMGSEEFFDEVFVNRVVAIDKADIFAGGDFETSISGGGLAGIFLVDDFNARVIFSIGIGDFAGGVGGTIVD